MEVSCRCFAMNGDPWVTNWKMNFLSCLQLKVAIENKNKILAKWCHIMEIQSNLANKTSIRVFFIVSFLNKVKLYLTEKWFPKISRRIHTWEQVAFAFMIGWSQILWHFHTRKSYAPTLGLFSGLNVQVHWLLIVIKTGVVSTLCFILRKNIFREIFRTKWPLFALIYIVFVRISVCIDSVWTVLLKLWSDDWLSW